MALVALVWLALSAQAAYAAPRSFFGIQAWSPPSNSEFKKMGRGGAGTFRFNLTWSSIEPREGERDWRGYDRIVGAAARAKITVLPVLYGSPGFAAPRETYPPRSSSGREAFARFIRDAVARYGRNGAFWAANPGVPYRPVTYWQAWNEPNFPAYAYGRPDAGEYASLLAVIWNAVKATDPRARVVLGGLPETRNGVPMTRYLRRLYRVPGVKAHFDVVAIHPYARDHRGALGAVKRARRIMNRNGDRGTPISVTEIGWATAGRTSARTRAFRTNRKGQASRLRKTYRTLIRYRGRYRVKMVVWFSWRDRPRLRGERNWWAINTGLFDRRGRAKPAWRAFKRVAP